MTKPIPPVVGEFAIFRDWSGDFELGEVTKVTKAKTVVKRALYGPKHLMTENIAFSGAEAAAKALAERLKSSATLCNREISAARLRHNARVAGLIAKASAHD